MRVLVSSAKGTNGNGYGAILAFDLAGSAWGSFTNDGRIVDPRGLCISPSGDLLYANSGDDRIVALDREGQIVRDTGRIEASDLGGGVFGPDGRYCVGSRQLRTIMALPSTLDGPARPLMPIGVVPFPRGFAFGPDGRLFLASGVGPSGIGEETIKVFDAYGELVTPRLVDDPQLSPLDLALASSGNIVVSCEWPFGASDAMTSVREYDSASGRLVRVFTPDGSVGFRNPRGLRVGPDGNVYCVARDEVVCFDFETGAFAGAIVKLSGLFGQALEFFD